MCGGFPHIKKSDTNYPESAHSTSWGLSCARLPPTSDAGSPGTHFCSIWLQIESSTMSSSSSIICYYGLQNPGKHFTYYYWFIKKDANEHTIEKVHKGRSGRILSIGSSVPVEFGIYRPLSSGCIHQLRNSLNLFVYMEASRHRHDWLNHWQLALIQSPLPLLPCPEVWEIRLKVWAF